MMNVLDVKAQLEARTATSISLGRFVALLHRWARRNAPTFDASKRKREQGYVWLSDEDARRFINWAATIDRSCYQSYPIPILWQRTKKGRHIYSWH